MVLGRGRPRKIDSDSIIEAVLNHKEDVLLSPSGIVSKQNDVWCIISQELGNAILPNSLYTFVTCNTYGVRDRLTNRLSVTVNDSVSLENSDLQVTNQSNHSVASVEGEAGTLQFYIFLTKTEFDELLINKTYKRTGSSQLKPYLRSCTVLQSGKWQEILSEKIWDATRLKCGFNFKNHHIANSCRSGSMNGQCKCGSTLRCEIIDSQEEDIRIKCTVNQGDNTCGKRYLRAPVRKAVAAELQGKSVSVYRAEKAKELMHPGDPEPPHLRSSNVLNTAKNEYAASMHLDRDPVLALAKMQLASHKNMIHHLSLNPFSVYYWTNHQKHAYRNYARDQPACIAIDATGSIVKKVTRCDGKTKSSHIFLYECVVRCDSRGQFSVAQMLTESHKTTSIQAWLMEWITSGAPCPKEVVCDSAKALLTASIRTFTSYSTIDEYADAFSDESVPSCWIRIDVAHFIHMYVRFLKGANRRIQTFFLASLGQLIQSRSVEDAAELLKSILIVARSETEGNFVTGQITPCEEHKERLKNRITVENPDLENLDNGVENRDSIDEDRDSTDEDTHCNSWSSWAKNIDNEVKTLVSDGDGNRDNAHFIPQLADRLVKDAKWLPLWSCAFRDRYGYGRVSASSASVESDFNQIKNRLLRNCNKPMRVDDFVQKHLDYINGRIKIAEAQSLGVLTTVAEDEPAQISIIEHEPTFPSNIDCVLTPIIDKPMSMPSSTPIIHGEKLCNTPIFVHSSPSSCPACINGDEPTGAHVCVVCQTPVHAFDLCSVACENNTEGYGQKRVCVSCNKLPNLPSALASQEIENWRGLALTKPKKNKKTSKYLQKSFSKHEFILHAKIKKLPIIRNGSDMTLQSVKIGRIHISLENTCAFDSLFQVFLAGACDRPLLKEHLIISAEINLFSKLIIHVLDKGLTNCAYRLRTEILTGIFTTPRRSKSGGSVLPCQVTVAHLVSLLFQDSPALAELTQCDKGCAPRNKKFARIQILHSRLFEADFNNIIENDVLLTASNQCGTKGCLGRESTVVTQIGNVILFEVFSIDSKADENAIIIALIPTQINVPSVDDVYHLIGVVHFEPPAVLTCTTRSTSSVPVQLGHYTAICRRRDGKWVQYDGLKKIDESVDQFTSVTPHIIAYAR